MQSQADALGENGSFLINGSNPVPFYNKYGWNSFANLLYVDQPAGTGFSYGKKTLDYDTGEGEIAKDMWNFMLEFYAMYPQYSKLFFFFFFFFSFIIHEYVHYVRINNNTMYM